MDRASGEDRFSGIPQHWVRGGTEGDDAIAILGWLVYGVLARQPAVFVANATTPLLISGLTMLKARPRAEARQQGR